MITPKEIISELMSAAEEFHEQDALGQAVVAFNPQEGIVEPGVLLKAPENFVTLPVRGPQENQWNVVEARNHLYPQIREKCV